jgi:hypothetical protein
VTLALRWSAPTRPVELRWRGQDFKPAAAAQINGPSALVAIVGPPGTAAADATVDAVAAANLSAGFPVAISRATGKMILADASIKSSAFVVGLITASTLLGFVASAAVNQLALANWTAVTGSVSLFQGQLYFLGVGGGLTTTPPGAPNCSVPVGTALNSTTMLIDPQPPIQL